MLNFFINIYFYKIISSDEKKKSPMRELLSNDQKFYINNFYLKNISIFIKFKKNYKYFSYIFNNNKNYKYISCTKRQTEVTSRKTRVTKTKLTFEEFLNSVFTGYYDLKVNKKTFLIFSNFLIFFFKSFENFFKKKLIKNSNPEFILFFFKKFFYKFKKIKSCKKNLQKRLLSNVRKKENFLY